MITANFFSAALLIASGLRAAETTAPTAAAGAVQHPAVFLVGDSIMKTGTGNGALFSHHKRYSGRAQKPQHDAVPFVGMVTWGAAPAPAVPPDEP